MTETPQREARADVHAESAIVARHRELQQVLGEWAALLAVMAAKGEAVRPAKNLLRGFLTDEVLPHIRAEERTLYPAAERDPSTSLLLRALVSEHRALVSRAERLAAQSEPTAIAAAAEAISALFASHVAKENYLLLPALERSGSDLRSLLAREDHLAGSW